MMDWSKKLLSLFRIGKSDGASSRSFCAPISPVRLEALEDRVLYDASLMGELVRGLEDGNSLGNTQFSAEYTLSPPMEDSPFLAGNLLEEEWLLASEADPPQAIEETLDESLGELERKISLLEELESGKSEGTSSHSNDTSRDSDPERLAVVDGSIEGVEDLVTDLLNQGLQESSILILDSNEDGVKQITRWLTQFSNVSELHFFAHADNDRLQFGSTIVSALNVDEFSSEFLAWQGGMAEDADWLIYGCELASTETGRSLIGELALWTGMDIGASSDLSGSSHLGGDWQLEFNSGDVSSRSFFENVDLKTSQQMQWSGLLNLEMGIAIGGDEQTTTALGRGGDRAVAMNSDGSFVMVWSEKRPGDTFEVFAKRFDANGIALAPEILVNQHSDKEQRYAAVGMDSSGNFVVTWTSKDQDGGGEGVYARRFASSGTPLGNEFQVNSVTGGDQSNSRIAVADDGSFVVVWQGNGSGDSDGIFGRRYDSAGNSLGSEFLVNTATGGGQRDASISINASGNFVVSWDDGNGFQYQRFNQSGAKVGGPVEVSDLSSAGNGSILLNDDGSVAVTWRSTPLGLTQTYVKVYDSADNQVRFSQVNDFTLSNEHTNPSISGSGAGAFVITWEGTTDTDVFARRFNADGTHASGVYSVADQDSGTQKFSSVAAISATKFAVVWTDDGTGTNAAGVYARTFGAESPVLDAGLTPALNPIDEGYLNSTGTLVSSLVPTGSVTHSSGFTDFGLAIVGVNAQFGTWQFSLDNGVSWRNIDARSINSSVNELALHLGPDARIRLIPYGNLNGAVPDAITFRAWDPRVGTEGEYSILSNPGVGNSAYSLATDTASISVAAVNDNPTFDVGPGFTTNSNGSQNFSTSVTQQVDGKTLVAGRFNNGTDFDIFVTRYNENGTLDLSFGTSGSVTFDIGMANDWANAVAVQSDGKIIVGGHGLIGGVSQQVVLRLDSSGNLDSTFATGGIFTNASGVTQELQDLKILKDGKILLTGSHLGAYRQYSVVQLLENGTFDNSFGTNGVVVTDLGNPAFARRLEVQDDGKIIVGGYRVVGGINQMSIARYLANGSLDATYGVGGIVNSSVFSNPLELESMALLRDGKLLIGATFNNGSSENMVIIRLDQNGNLDTTFQAVGFRAFDFGGTDELTRIAVDHDGSIFFIGNVDRGPSHAVVVKLQADGSNDLSFGTAGVREIDLGIPSNAFTNATAILIQPDGDLTIAGVTNHSGPLHNLVVRLDQAGNFDTQFATNLSFGGFYSIEENGAAIVIDSDAQIFDVELTAAQNLNGSRFSLSRDGGTNGNDIFGASGSLAPITEGGNLVVGGTPIGTVVSNSAGLLLLEFNNNATNDLVNQAIRQITYRNTASTAGTFVQINAVFNDGNTGAQGSSGALSTSSSARAIFNFVSNNNAPVLVSGTTSFIGITEDEPSNTGNSIGNFLSSSGNPISDLDSGALRGIAVVGFDSGNGTWQYSINNGSSWQNFSGVSDTTALLLRDVDRIRFVPDGENGATVTFTYRAWDQTGFTTGLHGSQFDASDNGGTRAFSTSTATISLLVESVNDAPLLDNSVTMTLTTITEDQITNSGDSVAAIIGSAGGDRISDVDSGAIEGIAITALDSGSGRWEYSFDGGGSWNAVGVVSESNALLLRDSDLIRFVPDQIGGTSANFTFRAWDQSGSTAGLQGTKFNITASGGTESFSSASGTAAITVTLANDAPVLDNAGVFTFATINESQTTNTGSLVSALINSAGGNRITDVDSGAVEGLAVIGTVSGNGSWQFSTNNGTTWSSFPAVSNENALLLRAEDRIRFLPDRRNGTTAEISFRAWDQTGIVPGQPGTTQSAASNGGTTPFSSAVATATINVTSLNDSPVLNNSGVMSLTAINENQINNSGNTIASIISSAGGDRITDIDTGSVEGIAIINTASGNGRWEYSINGGTVWNSVGAVSSSNALLLRSNDLIRFVPDGIDGTSAEFTFHAWDQTGGSAGLQGTKFNIASTGNEAPFSIATETASITVSSLNDAPELNVADTFPLNGITENQTNNPGELISALIASVGGDALSDLDIGAVEGVAITGLNSGNGVWQYSTDSGSSWRAVGVVSSTQSLLLRSEDRIRFVPNGETGTTATFSFRAWDRTTASTGPVWLNGDKVDTSINGGTSPFSSNQGTATIAVSDLNDAPIFQIEPGDSALSTLNETNGSLSTQGTITLRDVDLIEAVNVMVQGVVVAGNSVGLAADVNSLLGMLSTSNRVNLDAGGTGVFNWGFDSDSEFFNYLAEGEILSLTYQLQVSDGIVQTNQSLVIEIHGTNDQPIFNLPTETRFDSSQIMSPQGIVVSSFVDGPNVISDLDYQSEWGIAIDSLTSEGGFWQYQMSGSTEWIDAVLANQNSRVFLESTDRLRFLSPSGSATGAIRFHSWDQSAGQSGIVDVLSLGSSTTISSAFATANLVAVALPTLAPTSFESPNTESGESTENDTTSESETKSSSESSSTQPDTGGATGTSNNSTGSESQPVKPVSGILSDAFNVDSSTNSTNQSSQRIVSEVEGSVKSSHETYYERKISAGKLIASWDDLEIIAKPALSSLDDAAAWNNLFASMDRSSQQFMLNQFEIGMPTFVASTASMLTVGYLAWIVRGGVLLTTFMTSLPTWKTLDIGPLLDELKGEDKETIEQIVDSGA